MAEPFLGRARRLAERQLASIGQTFFVYDPWVGLVSIVVLAVATPRLAIAGTLASVLARLCERFRGTEGTGYESKDLVVLLGPRIVAVVRGGVDGQPKVTTFED